MSQSTGSDGGWKNMRVKAEAKAEAEEAKRDNETWSDYLRRCADADPIDEGNGLSEEEVTEIVEGTGVSEDDVKVIVESTVRQLVVDEALR